MIGCSEKGAWNRSGGRNRMEGPKRNPGWRWIFPDPHPDHAGEPCWRHTMRTWWDEAQVRAGLSDIERLGWHSLRRKSANDLRPVPLKDVAQLGGWKDVNTILTCYLSEVMDAMQAALATRQSCREYGDKEGEPGRILRQHA
jgi:integrase